jgi:beta-galactosidase
MLDHQGRKDHSYAETAEVFGELTRLAEVIDATRFVASAAMLYSDEIGWAWNHVVSARLRSVMATCDVSTQGRMLRWYAPLYWNKISVDILDPLRDLSAYKVVFAPNLYLIHSGIVENIKRYVEAGGTLIVGPKAALKDWNNVFIPEVPPCGGLAEVFGVTVKPAPFRLGRDEVPARRVTILPDAPFAGGMSFRNEGLFDYLEPQAAAILAVHENGDAAIALNEYGKGSAIYMGCQPEEGFYSRFIEWLTSAGKLDPVLRTDADVEITLRVGGGRRLIFVLNHRAEPAQIALEKEYHELIAGRAVSGVLIVEGKGVRILAEGSN